MRLTAEHPNWLGFCHNDLQCGNIMLDTAPSRLMRTRLGFKDSPASISQVRTLSFACWLHLDFMLAVVCVGGVR